MLFGHCEASTAITERPLVQFEAQRSNIEHNSVKLSHYGNNSNFTKQHKSAPKLGISYYGALQVPVMGHCKFLSWGTSGSYQGVLQVPVMGHFRLLSRGTAGSYHGVVQVPIMGTAGSYHGALQAPIMGYCRFLSWGTAGSYHGALQGLYSLDKTRIQEP